MKHVQENLNHYKDFQFFSILEEKELQKNNNENGDDTKQIAENNKDCQNIIKKMNDNFNRFLNYAGDQMTEFKNFWIMQQTARKNFNKAYTPLYAMFNDGNKSKYVPKYYVAVKTVYSKDKKEITQLSVIELTDNYRNIIFLTNKDASSQNEMNFKELFTTQCSPEIINQFKDFINEVGKIMTEKKDYYIKHVENKQKEAELKIKRESLNKFLKESEDQIFYSTKDVHDDWGARQSIKGTYAEVLKKLKAESKRSGKKIKIYRTKLDTDHGQIVE